MTITGVQTYLVSVPLRRLHAQPFADRDGSLIVPDRPGLGVELDEAKLQKYGQRAGR